MEVQLTRNVQSRKEYVDIAKGLLIYIVFVGHLVPISGTLSTIIFSFHMAAFYIISGYVSGNSYQKSFLKFIKRKFVSYIFPFVFFCILGISIHLLETGGSLLTDKAWLKSLYLGQPTGIFCGSGWFLFALFWGEVIFYIWKNKIEEMPVPARIFFLFVLFITAMNILDILNLFGFGRLPLKLDSGLYAGFFIILGNLLRKYDIEKIIFSSGLLSFLSFVTVLAAISKLNGWVNIANCKCNSGELFLITSICGTLAIFIIANYLSGVHKYIYIYLLKKQLLLSEGIL